VTVPTPLPGMIGTARSGRHRTAPDRRQANWGLWRARGFDGKARPRLPRAGNLTETFTQIVALPSRSASCRVALKEKGDQGLHRGRCLHRARHRPRCSRATCPSSRSTARCRSSLKQLPKEQGELVKDIVPSQITVSGIQRVLQILLCAICRPSWRARPTASALPNPPPALAQHCTEPRAVAVPSIPSRQVAIGGRRPGQWVWLSPRPGRDARHLPQGLMFPQRNE
jgi:hypothetical protein